MIDQVAEIVDIAEEFRKLKERVKSLEFARDIEHKLHDDHANGRLSIGSPREPIKVTDEEYTIVESIFGCSPPDMYGYPLYCDARPLDDS